MIQLISCAIALFIVFGIPYLLEQKGNNNNQRSQGGKNGYDYKDYVNKHLDD